jgi:hypothetical protein
MNNEDIIRVRLIIVRLCWQNNIFGNKHVLAALLYPSGYMRKRYVHRQPLIMTKAKYTDPHAVRNRLHYTSHYTKMFTKMLF